MLWSAWGAKIRPPHALTFPVVSHDKNTPVPETLTPPPAESGDVARTGSGSFEKAFSEQRGINIVNFVPPSGVMPEPGGLPAATGAPAETPAAVPPAPVDVAPPPAPASSSTEE